MSDRDKNKKKFSWEINSYANKRDYDKQWQKDNPDKVAAYHEQRKPRRLKDDPDSYYARNRSDILKEANSNYATNDDIYLANLQENIAKLVADRIAVQSKKQAIDVQHNRYKKAEKLHLLTKAEARKQVDESFVFKGIAIPIELYEELKKELAVKSITPDRLNKILWDYLRDLQPFSLDLELLHNKYNTLQDKNKSLQDKNKSLQDKNKSLQDKNKSLQKIRQDDKVVITTTQMLASNHYQELQSKNESLQTSNKSLQTKCKTLQTYINALQNTLYKKRNALQYKNESSQTLNESLQTKCSTLQADRNALQRKNKSLQDKLQKIKNDSKILKTEFRNRENTLLQDCKILKTELAKREQKTKQQGYMKAYREANKERIAENQKRYREANKERLAMKRKEKATKKTDKTEKT